MSTVAPLAVVDAESGMARLWGGRPGPAGVGAVGLNGGAVELVIDVADPSRVRSVEALLFGGRVPTPSLVAVEHLLGQVYARALEEAARRADGDGLTERGLHPSAPEVRMTFPETSHSVGHLALARTVADDGADLARAVIALLDAAGIGLELPPVGGAFGPSVSDARTADRLLADGAVDEVIEVLERRPDAARRLRRRVTRVQARLTEHRLVGTEELVRRLERIDGVAAERWDRPRSDRAVSGPARSIAHDGDGGGGGGDAGPWRGVHRVSRHLEITVRTTDEARSAAVHGADGRLVGLGAFRPAGDSLSRAVMPVPPDLLDDESVVVLTDRPRGRLSSEAAWRTQRAVRAGRRAAVASRGHRSDAASRWRACSQLWLEAGDARRAADAERIARRQPPAGFDERRLGPVVPPLITDDLV